jgi:hypothetical protein
VHCPAEDFLRKDHRILMRQSDAPDDTDVRFALRHPFICQPIESFDEAMCKFPLGEIKPSLNIHSNNVKG